FAGVEVEGVYRAVAEVADEQSVIELAETFEGRPGHPPRRIELALFCEPLQQISVRIEDIDEPVPRASDVVMLVLVLKGVSHVQVAIDGRDTEGRVAGGELRVFEHTLRPDGLEVGVEDVYRAGVEVSGEQESP